MVKPKNALPEIPAPACATCQFYLPLEGLCRRYPPSLVVTSMYQKGKDRMYDAAVRFPGMLPNGWCGEFKQKLNG